MTSQGFTTRTEGDAAMYVEFESFEPALVTAHTLDSCAPLTDKSHRHRH